MAYKNKKELVQVGIRLNEVQKAKFDKMMQVEVNGMVVTVSAAKIITKIVADYLDSLPSVEGAAAVGCDESIDNNNASN